MVKDELENISTLNEWSITYKQIGLLFVAFVAGIIMTITFSNVAGMTTTTFNVDELIIFVMTVLLSGASIVLAITAIILGKNSEVSVIRRSDESIRLQNEVFVKTTEALQRIESSTGVTEKRIEDIIAGRVGDMSHEIAEIASKKRTSFSELEQQISDVIQQKISEESSLPSSKANEAREKRRKYREYIKEYEEHHQRIMNAFCNRSDLIVEKTVLHGNFDASGKELFDGIFKKDDLKLSVSTFEKDVNIDTIKHFISKAMDEIMIGTINFVIIVKLTDEYTDLLQKVEPYIEIYNEGIKDKLIVIELTPDNIEEKISRLEITG